MSRQRREHVETTPPIRRLMFVVSEDWYFVSHRFDLAKRAMLEGWTVTVACRQAASSEQIESAGIGCRNWNMPRGSINPFRLLRSVWTLRKEIKEFGPTQIHAVSIVTVALARLALTGLGNISLVGTVAGLGRFGSTNAVLQILLKPGLKTFGRWVSNGGESWLVVQNSDDFTLLSSGINSPHRIRLIPGSGINPAEFPPTPAATEELVTITLMARMIRDKGIVEFVQAVEILAARGLNVRGLLVGKPDLGNPRSLSPEELAVLTAGTLVEWLGHRDDSYQIIADTDIVCLPTYYGEGIPRVLLEAGCVGRPIVSCRVPGPKDLVREGIDGLLVEPQNADELADALAKLVTDQSLRRKMGESLNDRVVRDFSNTKILASYLDLYRSY
jgi:glycosyltransferase involved in cell wall biosynthesis